MVVLLVLTIWAGLALVVAGLFVAVIRGGGGTDLPALPDLAPAGPVALPLPRVASAHEARSLSESLGR